MDKLVAVDTTDVAVAANSARVMTRLAADRVANTVDGGATLDGEILQVERAVNWRQ